MQLHKIHEKNNFEKLLDQIKSKTVFLDESYVVSSIARKETQVIWKDENNIVDSLYGKGEYQLLLETRRTERRRIKLEHGNKFGLVNQIEERRLHEVLSKIQKMDYEIKLFQNIFKFVHPLSPKLIIGFQPRITRHLNELYSYKQTLSKNSPKYFRSPIMQIIDGELSPYCAGNKIEQHSLGIVLKPYFARTILQPSDIVEELMSQKSKYLTSLEVARNAKQHSRCKTIDSKLKEVVQFHYLIESIGKKFRLIGKKLKGVKTQLKINGRLTDWPDCLVTNISNRYRQSTVVNDFEVNNTSSKDIPAVALGRLHIFTENLTDTIALREYLSAHQYNKFRPFSLFKKRLDSNYPLHNSIWWP